MEVLFRGSFTLYVGLVAALSLAPKDTLGETGSFDKVAHFTAYFIMALLGLIAFKSSKSKAPLILFCLSVGVVLELLQYFVSGRAPSLADATANFAGVFAGVLLARLAAASNS